jgi:short-subunit dehydrogenase
MSNKLAVITGAASGIGLALTQECLAEGMDVVMVDNHHDRLETQAKRLSLTARTTVMNMLCDITKAEDVKQIAQTIHTQFNRIDLLINNAGISGPLAPVWELKPDEIQQVFAVNLYGMLHCIQAFLPCMLEQDHASHIVNMASYYGLCSGSQMAAYSMSKHAVLALTESLYFDLQRLNKPIDVSVVCPSITNTKLFSHSQPKNESKLHQMVGLLLEHGRPVEETAAYIMSAVHQKVFYILPDPEVKQYCEQRSQAIINQTLPHKYNFEKIFDSLLKKYGDASSCRTHKEEIAETM